uniref:Uncharacterized protein n=1 Tax=Maylandia zebra TaxID=106582 RepID=A0A3P9CGF7_9CICH
IRPISNTVEIFVTGLDAASLSFLASNFGLKSSTGNLYANDGISFSSSFPSSFFSSSLLFNSIWCMMFSLEENIWKRTASHICVALGESLVWFSFWVLGSSPAFSTVFVSFWSCPVTTFSEPVSGNLGSACSTTMCVLSLDQPLALDFNPFGFNMALRRDSPAGDSVFLSCSLSATAAETLSRGNAAVLGFEPLGVILVTFTGFPCSFISATSAFFSGIDFCSAVGTFSLPRSFFTAFRGSWSPPLGKGCLVSGVFGLVS